MEVKIHGRSVTITDRFENYIAAKIEKGRATAQSTAF